MSRPLLCEISMTGIEQPTVIITMSPGQWDSYLQAGYDAGFVLLELDHDERPIRAFKKTMN